MKYELTVEEFLSLLERSDLEVFAHQGRGLSYHSPGAESPLPMTVLPLVLEVALAEWTTWDGGPDELIPWLEALVHVVKDSRVDVVDRKAIVYWPAYRWPIDVNRYLTPEDPGLVELDRKLTL